MNYRTKAYESSLKAHKKLIATKLLDGIEKLYENKASERRWIWELLQNAKDVSENKVEIQVFLKPESIEFKHNGNPFLMDNITYLIEQVSTKDRASESDEILATTGKFGTGFMTTHLLSKKVEVQGILEDQDTEPPIYKHFCLKLDRDAKTPDEMITNVDASYRVFEDLDNEEKSPPLLDYKPCKYLDTSFKYALDREGLEIANVGIQDLHNALCYTLIFIPKIESVSVIDEIRGTEVKYSLLGEKSLGSNIKISTVQSRSGKGCELSIIASVANDKNTIVLAIPLQKQDNNFSVINFDPRTPKLFCDFPLIGSEQFDFPTILNSPLFNPSEPRDNVLLDERNDEKRRFNKSIFEESLELYYNLLDYASENWSDVYHLASSSMPSNLDYQWYKEKIQKPIRNKLLDTPVVETHQNEQILLRNALFPHHRSKEQVTQLWQLVLALYPDRLPKKDHILGWYSIIDGDWKKDLNLNLRYELSDLVQDIAHEGNLTQLGQRLSKSETKTLEWLNQVINFVEQQESSKSQNSLLNKYPIIPNQYGNFQILDKLCKDMSLPEQIKYVLKVLDEDWKQKLAHLGIRCQFSKQLDIKQASSTIDKIIKANQHPDLRKAIYYLISCYPNQDVLNQTEYQFRTKIWELTKGLNEFVPDPQFLDNWVPELWIECDLWLLKNLVFDLVNIRDLPTLQSRLKKNSQDETVAWLSNFISFLNRDPVWRSFYLEKKILPNQRGVFCEKDHLYFDQEIPEEIKDVLEKILVDYRSKLLDHRIQGFETHPHKLGVKDASNEINQYLTGDRPEQTTLEDPYLREAMFSLLTYFDENLNDTRQKIWILARTFYGENLIAEIKIIPNLKDFQWNQCNQWVLKVLSLDVSKQTSLKQLSQYLKISQEEATQYLDDLISFTNDQNLLPFLAKLKIWPNQYGFFLEKKEIKKDGGIEPVFKEVCSFLTKNDWCSVLLLKDSYLSKVQNLFEEKETELLENIAQEIDQALKSYEGNPRDYNFEHPFRLLLTWSQTKSNETVKTLFPYFHSRKSHLFLDIYGDQVTNDRLFTLMQIEPEKLEALTNLANNSAISPEDIDRFVGNPSALKTLESVKEKIFSGESATEVLALLEQLGLDLDALQNLFKFNIPSSSKMRTRNLAFGECNTIRNNHCYPQVITFEDVENHVDTGLKGEEFVYQRLIAKFGVERVQWMNKHGEGWYPYDFKVLEENLEEVAYYVDAKSSRKGEHSDGQVFFSITNAQWDFLKECKNYYIAKVFRATSERPNLQLIHINLQDENTLL